MISEISKLLENSEHPIARSFFKSERTNTLVIGFRPDMTLKNHKTPYRSKLIVLQGKVNYKEENGSTELLPFQEQEIMPNVLHQVLAYEESICLLIQELPM
jgi:quercetin dioxygenase-like cupin family protein